jgi:hypothetical protein
VLFEDVDLFGVGAILAFRDDGEKLLLAYGKTHRMFENYRLLMNFYDKYCFLIRNKTLPGALARSVASTHPTRHTYDEIRCFTVNFQKTISRKTS